MNAKAPHQAAAPDVQRLFSERARAIQSSAIREILKVTERPEVISFAGGLPAPATFPVDEMQAALTHVLATRGREALQYSTTKGLRRCGSGLRRACRRLRHRCRRTKC